MTDEDRIYREEEQLRARVTVLEKALESSCDEQREMLWEASGVGHGCKRAIDAEAEVTKLRNQIKKLKRKVKELEKDAIWCGDDRVR